jgi:hypothetical protein
MNKKHKKTLELIFKMPTQSNVHWDDIEALIIELGGQVSEGRGSRVRIELNGVKSVFHRPHPKPETDKGALKSMRRFLVNARIQHDEI